MIPGRSALIEALIGRALSKAKVTHHHPRDREMTLTDQTTKVKCTLWEPSINSWEYQKEYCLSFGARTPQKTTVRMPR